ncbi:MAG: LysR family transcriptional regulator [Proteobacteria bacterium]|nr:LysR family transcriptional regulator [Pseudomonadota bacterium]
MDLNDIVVFTKVVETKSFTGAADLLGLPKSTVSRKLAQLEERLGVRLVQRTTRKLAVTDIGEAYYARCARIVADVAAAEQVVMDMQATPRGRLRVTAPIDLSDRYLGEIIATFLVAHPDVSVELEATDRTVDLIEEGFDLAIRFGTLQESTLIARRVCAIHTILCAAPAYLARRGDPEVVDDLDAHDRLLFTPTPRNQTWTIASGDATHEFGRPSRFASNNFGAVRDLALAGGGIALLSNFMVEEDIGNGRLVRVLPTWSGRVTDVHAVYPARQNIAPRLALFVEHLVKSFHPSPWSRP